MGMMNEEDELEDKLFAENYKIWRKNVPFLYDVMIAQALEWPSITVQWLPDKIQANGKGQSERRLILGTHTTDSEQNHLMIAKVTIPEEEDSENRKYSDETEEAGGYGNAKSKIEIVQRINHQGEVNRARYMPQNPCVIASKGPGSSVYIFDYTKHPSIPSSDGSCRADLILTGHSKQGYGLSWNPAVAGRLASGSEDGSICVWDVEAACSDKSKVPPLCSFTHAPVVEDTTWHLHEPKLLISVGDDSRICLWDSESGGSRPVAAADKAHGGEINCVSCSGLNPYLLLTGAADESIALWDLRNLGHKVHSCQANYGPVLQVEWSPKHPNVFASASEERRVCIWDLERVGEKQCKEDAHDGPPELLFLHAGHTHEVTDLSWDPNDPWLLASVAQDNMLHVWRMDECNYAPPEAPAPMPCD